MKICVVASAPRSLTHFRGELLAEMSRRGHQVVAFAPRDNTFAQTAQNLKHVSVSLRSFPLRRNIVSPFWDALSMRALLSEFQRVKPDLVLAYTMKPVAYSGIVLRAFPNAAFFPLISGQGLLGSRSGGLVGSTLSNTSTQILRIALSRASGVLFQNIDDERHFRNSWLIPNTTDTVVVNGSGVDLKWFAPTPIPKRAMFLMLSRLLWDKGVGDFVKAAEFTLESHPDAGFRLAGGIEQSRGAIPRSIVSSWSDAGVVDYLGFVRDVRPLLSEAQFVVLPSVYGEGVPRSLLEALAFGRPIITTDSPGCREAIGDGGNGFLVPGRDPRALAEAMSRAASLPLGEVEAMGQESRRLAEMKFDVVSVNRKMLAFMGL